MRYSEYKMYESLLKDNEEHNKKIDEKPADPKGDLILVGSVIGLIIYFILLLIF